MQTVTTEKAIDPETDLVAIAMPLKDWWLVEAALSTAEHGLDQEANICLANGWVEEADVWYRIARDTGLARTAVAMVLTMTGWPQDFIK